MWCYLSTFSEYHLFPKAVQRLLGTRLCALPCVGFKAVFYTFRSFIPTTSRWRRYYYLSFNTEKLRLRLITWLAQAPITKPLLTPWASNQSRLIPCFRWLGHHLSSLPQKRFPWCPVAGLAVRALCPHGILHLLTRIVTFGLWYCICLFASQSPALYPPSNLRSSTTDWMRTLNT